jgi:leukotriene-A4 hydrolase
VCLVQESIRDLGPDNNFTALIPDLSTGIDPDDAFSKIPYEKGFYFLYYLQVLSANTLFLFLFVPWCLSVQARFEWAFM